MGPSHVLGSVGHLTLKKRSHLLFILKAKALESHPKGVKGFHSQAPSLRAAGRYDIAFQLTRKSLPLHQSLPPTGSSANTEKISHQ